MPTPVKSVLPVVLLGCGGVGRYLLRHIVSCRPLHANQGVAIRVVGVADSSSLLVAKDVHSTGLDDALLTQLCAAKSAGSPLSSLFAQGHCQLFKNPEARGKVIDAATTLGRTTGLVLVDCSATYDTVSLLKDAVDHGCCIVLANKKPLTGAYEDFQKLVSNFRRIRFESTVGAGLPVIASVTRIIASGDPISRIVGSLSGTLGYVMSELEDGKKFSEVVKNAKSLGYTEPDPRDDLGGMDVARKYGGGRNIRLGGETLSAEEKAAKDKRTKELVAAYRNRQNIVIDAKTKAECIKALREGDEMMNTGRLKQALSYYEKVMDAVDFKTELHGKAALQWSICLDSLCRSKEAMSMYSKLKNHPNIEIRKKANMFVFSFQAMEFMKVSSIPVPKSTGYETYFTKFGSQKNYYASLDEPEAGIGQIIPYMIFLVSPIFIVAFVALRKSFQL